MGKLIEKKMKELYEFKELSDIDIKAVERISKFYKDDAPKCCIKDCRSKIKMFDCLYFAKEYRNFP